MSETGVLAAMLKGVTELLVEAFNSSESLLLGVIMMLHWNTDMTIDVMG